MAANAACPTTANVHACRPIGSRRAPVQEAPVDVRAGACADASGARAGRRAPVQAAPPVRARLCGNNPACARASVRTLPMCARAPVRTLHENLHVTAKSHD
ncbi:UNVERIFIED_CONTAM: hypothetical protein Sindi_2415600 [Sesamum indicum]